MNSFLTRIAKYISEHYADRMHEVTVVFPNKRAGVFFRKALSETVDRPVWAPSVMSVQELMTSRVPEQLPDQMTLLFELYAVYRHYFENQTFEQFISWGEMMLRDFDEIDKYLIEPKKLFELLFDHKEIEERFFMDMKDEPAIKQFIEHITGSEDEHEYARGFMAFWKQLGYIYRDFKNRLTQKAYAYEGMVYRKVANEPSAYFQSKSNKKYVFAGFNALNPAEEKLIRFLVGEGLAKIFWDSDHYYMDSQIHEAGRFLREYRKDDILSSNLKKPSDRLSKDAKRIHISAVPLFAGQARLAGNILKDLDVLDEQTAVVLGDEQLLFPALNAIPAKVETVNVTMGYPLTASPVYSFLEKLRVLQEQRSLVNGEICFFVKDLAEVFRHPLIESGSDIDKAAFEKIFEEQHSVLIEASHPSLKDKGELVDAICKIPGKAVEVLAYLKTIFSYLSTNSQKNENNQDEMFLGEVLAMLNRISELTEEYPDFSSADTVWRMISKLASVTRVPFTGEPLGGLQLMGMLETRCLDFKNIILLSVNEEIMPSGPSNRSLILFNLRKSFGLPTFNEQDAIMAYHFYRLLQGAENIHIIYNTEPGPFGGSGPSRFILQLEHELKNHNLAAEITHNVEMPGIDSTHLPELRIVKNEAIMNKLMEFTVEGGGKRKFYPSYITGYIYSQVGFYTDRLLRIQDIDEPEEDIDAMQMGSIMHKVMELLYQPFLGEVVSADLIETCSKNIEPALHKAFELEVGHINKKMRGKTILLYEVMKRLTEKMIEADKAYAPFTLIALENQMKAGGKLNFETSLKISKGHEIGFSGKADRIDEKDGIIRIIDYKTGFTKWNKTAASLPDLWFENYEYSAMLQTAMYAWLYLKNYPGENVVPCIWPVRSPGTLHQLKIDGGIESLFPELEAALIALLDEIFDNKTDFVG